MTRAKVLLAYAQVHPEGFTNEQAMAALGWSIDTFDKAVRAVRLFLRDYDHQLMAVPGPDDPPGKPWVYSLAHCSGDIAQNGRDLHRRKVEGHLKTALALADSMANASDPRSSEGKKDRMIRTALVALRDQLAIIDA